MTTGRWTPSATAVSAIVAAGLCLTPTNGSADTLLGSLALAYQNNPQLNSQRAILRQTDETVPQALSGYRPTINATATAGSQFIDTLSKSVSPTNPNQAVYTESQFNFAPRTVGVTATQTLYNGLRTANRTRAAEGQVSAARETLRLIEQTVLLNAATAYMNLLRDEAILELQRNNVRVLQEQLRQTRDRFNVGEVTKTDVAQSESRLAAGQSQLLAAQSNVVTSKAAYRQAVGIEPGKLAPGAPVDRLSPRTLSASVAQGRAQHPQVTAAMFGIDVASLQVRIAVGALYPTVTLNANAQQAWETQFPQQLRQFSTSLIGQVSVPIYQGGAEYSTIRQSKETLGQKRLDLETARDQIQATVTQAWGQLDAAKAQIESTQSQVTAAEVALNGVREEARVGQRTTLDVLNAQQELVNARVALVTAQRDRVVASYTLLSSVGRLDADTLRLRTPVYDPITHYQQVRDSWAGVRTPDGR